MSTSKIGSQVSSSSKCTSFLRTEILSNFIDSLMAERISRRSSFFISHMSKFMDFRVQPGVFQSLASSLKVSWSNSKFLDKSNSVIYVSVSSLLINSTSSLMHSFSSLVFERLIIEHFLNLINFRAGSILLLSFIPSRFNFLYAFLLASFDIRSFQWVYTGIKSSLMILFLLSSIFTHSSVR